MPRCGCQGKPARYSSGLSLRKSSSSRNGSNSLVSPKPKARRRCTPAPSSVGLDWMIFLTGRMDIVLGLSGMAPKDGDHSFRVDDIEVYAAWLTGLLASLPTSAAN